MYKSYPSLVIGFHGCDKEIGLKLLNQEIPFKSSNNNYDWLGSGMYFWENNSGRAFHYACEIQGRDSRIIKEPFVIGAVLNLGYCFDLLDHENIGNLEKQYKNLKIEFDSKEKVLPKNSPDKKLHFLDKLVIDTLCEDIEKGKSIFYDRKFDTVRAAYIEGNNIYPDSGLKSKNHIQICVRNPNCIKGVFLPREHDSGYDNV